VPLPVCYHRFASVATTGLPALTTAKTVSTQARGGSQYPTSSIDDPYLVSIMRHADPQDFRVNADLGPVMERGGSQDPQIAR
jgi:hypothetical protein